MDCLSQFGDISGLRINANKSNVFMAGINSIDMAEIKTITGFRMGKFPFRYLGIPMAATKLTIEQFMPLTAKISEYISAWVGATLSYAGRSELIRSVIQGVECFWLSILPIPVEVKDKIVTLYKNFLWGEKAASPKKPLVAWKDVCKPKSEGGLGFIDLNAWNMALMSKSLWNLQAKKDSLWVKWVSHIYLKAQTLWEYNPTRQDSQMIRQLAQIRDKIMAEEGSCLAKLAITQTLSRTSSYAGFQRPSRDFSKYTGSMMKLLCFLFAHGLE
ncbi:hypothetical protein Acr_25g0000870 [Actinidia rufa]|uniref:Uncharacterized protein n=1 Tax=Actinidia rufa TaxID=165716 RepID=A0A7J0GY76_9ERIC|nr:hypothetical protein Acr_25g0000870 [Actinidia rufa]